MDAGYDVQTASDFPEAAFNLKTSQFETVIVDIRLGEFNGLQLAERARRAGGDVRIVVMSAWCDPVLKAEAARLGAVYLDKPFTASQLSSALASAPVLSTPPNALEFDDRELLAIPSARSRQSSPASRL